MSDEFFEDAPGRAPGSKSKDSRAAGGLLGHIPTASAGMTYEQFLQERIAATLAVNDTRISPDASMHCRQAETYLADAALTGNWDFQAVNGADLLQVSAESTATSYQKRAVAE